jgi:hypothetical protein
MIVSLLVGVCNSLPQVTTSTAPSPTPTVPVIPWETKFDAFRDFLLQQPDQNATKGFGSGPYLRKTFDDGECLQMGLINWDCTYELPYKMRGVVKFFDDMNIRNSDPIWDPWRYYNYGYYVDPDDGWNYYGSSRLSFGACGNRGPQSSCGHLYCVDKEGKTPENSQVPEGQTPWMDPNRRSRLCPWL